MKYSLKFSSILMVVCLSFFAQGEEVSQDTLYNLMVLSGMKSQVEDLSGAVIAMVQQSGQIGNRKERMETLASALEPQIFLDDISREIGKLLTENEAKELIAWYESNLGNRLARAEESASTPAAFQEMQKLAQELFSNTERMNSARKIANAGNMIDQGLKIQRTVFQAGLVATAKAQYPDKPVDLDRIKAVVEEQVASMNAEMEQSILIQLAYTFREFDIATLDEYVEFLQNPAMKKFNDAGFDGSRIALEKAITKYASSVAVN